MFNALLTRPKLRYAAAAAAHEAMTVQPHGTCHYGTLRQHNLHTAWQLSQLSKPAHMPNRARTLCCKPRFRPWCWHGLLWNFLQLFPQYEEQVAALEALRQKEAAEARTLKAALDSQKTEWQQQLKAEQNKR